MQRIKYYFFLLLLLPTLSNATPKIFYVSLRSDDSNIRSGPGGEYLIKYTYKLKGVPLKVLGDYENWYKVVDKDNEEGWVNKNLTTKKRGLIVINGTQIAYKNSNTDSEAVYRLQENVILEYDKCSNEWCRVKINRKNCWVEKKSVWGW